MQDCGISSALALEIPQSCTEPSKWYRSNNWEAELHILPVCETLHDISISLASQLFV